MPPRDSFWGTVLIALILCVVCSAVVSTAAVLLKPRQDANKALDKKKNILLAASLCEPGTDAETVSSIYEESIVEHLVDIDTGEVVDPDAEELDIDPESYDPRKAANDTDLREEIADGALPGISHREPYTTVYEIQKNGQTDGYILPIYGKGLWSTLYGFLAVKADKETVRGITFYSHAETPGLGGEVDNPGWKALWPGKKIYESEGEVALGVVKGRASDEYGVDGLSGATITSKGVDQMVKYWLGPKAFGKYLAGS